MKESNLFMRAEDDMDFMPIIPLNESDNETLNEIEIPKELPVLPLRNTVLFPGVVLPITVGRDKSIKAVNDAYKADKLIGVLAQKDSNIEDPSVSDLEDVGTVARVIKLIKMPDGGTTVILQGKRRFKVGAVTAEDPYFKAQVVLLQEEEAPKDQDFEAEQTVLESTHSESSSSTVGVVISEEQQVSDEETISCPTNVAKAVSSNHTERDLQVPQDESEPQLPLTFSGPEPVAPSSPTQPVISDPRHRRVYELWRRGLTVEEIAKELGTGRGEIQLLLYQWTVKR